MTAPTGRWRIIANGFQGDLDMTCDTDGNVRGTLRIDSPSIDPINGSWNEAAQRINFSREVTAAGGSLQHYTGFLFEAAAPLFQPGIYGPSVVPTFRILAGSFDAYGSGGSDTRPMYGWVAQQHM